jgi:hypothetical protein
MKNYIASIAIATLGFYGAFYMEIPVDNQIAMALIGCLGAAMILLTAAHDLKSRIERKAIERHEASKEASL